MTIQHLTFIFLSSVFIEHDQTYLSKLTVKNIGLSHSGHRTRLIWELALVHEHLCVDDSCYCSGTNK
jgi:hypothetical protein